MAKGDHGIIRRPPVKPSRPSSVKAEKFGKKCALCGCVIGDTFDVCSDCDLILIKYGEASASLKPESVTKKVVRKVKRVVTRFVAKKQPEPEAKVRTGSFKDLCAGKFRGEVCFIVARSNAFRARFKHLLDEGEVIEHFARFGPSDEIHKNFKATGNQAAYTTAFIPYIQEKSKTYPAGRLEHLRELIEEYGGSVRLICHENEGEFCHRHLLVSLL
jgi:hypothetical protein